MAATPISAATAGSGTTMPSLDRETRSNENLQMDSEPKDEKGERGDAEQSEEIPQSKLRDLRPEKDPMGARRKAAPKRTASRSIR